MNLLSQKLSWLHPIITNTSILSKWALAGMAFATSPLTQALDYGIYDTRSLAMGGAGVASANTQNALFYNPSLLAMYDQDEESTRNGRVYLPILVGQINENIEETYDIIDENLDDQLSAAVAAYNAEPTDTGAAQVVVDASSAFRDGIVTIGNEDIEGDAFFGLMVSEPSDRAGGSFYFGSRAIAGVTSTVSDEDLSLLNQYIEAMEIAAAGGNPQTTFPDLFDEGVLVDPAESITSSASLGSLLISEWGVSVSKEFKFWGQPVALGATPKVLRVDVFRDDISYADSDLDYSNDKRSHITMNVDVGLTLPIGENFRFALASKDILPKTYEGAEGLSVETKARSRAGLAFIQKWLTLTVDADLQKNKVLGSELARQEIAAGMEIRLIPWVHFRGGYRHDLEGFRSDVISAGVGFRTGRFVADAAYAYSEDIQGAGVQLGWTF